MAVRAGWNFAPGPEPEQYHVSGGGQEEGQRRKESGGGEIVRGSDGLRSFVADKGSGEGLHEDIAAEDGNASVHGARVAGWIGRPTSV